MGRGGGRERRMGLRIQRRGREDGSMKKKRNEKLSCGSRMRAVGLYTAGVFFCFFYVWLICTLSIYVFETVDFSWLLSRHGHMWANAGEATHQGSFPRSKFTRVELYVTRRSETNVYLCLFSCICDHTFTQSGNITIRFNITPCFPTGFFETMAGDIGCAKYNVRDLLCNYQRCNNIYKQPRLP